MNDENEIFRAIKKARQERKLSQRELSARIGVPQSHISRIESGQVDLQLSSLTQIARALDLEIKLVPRNSLPAVESIIRSVAGFPRNRSQPAQAEIARMKRILEGIEDSFNLDPKVQKQLESINLALNDVRERFIDTDAFVRIRKVSEQIQDALSKLNLPAVELQPETLRAISTAERSLRNLRNNLAHRHELEDFTNRPAYSLEEDDDE